MEYGDRGQSVIFIDLTVALLLDVHGHALVGELSSDRNDPKTKTALPVLSPIKGKVDGPTFAARFPEGRLST